MAIAVSIITPSYNQECYIERTIQSVLSQDIPELEYVVVDGRSTDKTTSILKQYETRLQWVSEQDDGQADAINKGIRMTTGEVIGWLNSDDIYYPGAIRQVVDYFTRYPEVDVVYGDAYHIDKQDRVIEKYTTEAWNVNRLRDICYLCQPAVFFRRKIFEKYGILDRSLQYCMDYEYWLRLSAAGVNFSYIPVILAGSRLYPGNKTLGCRIKVHAEINTMLLKHFGRVPDQWIFNYGHVIAERGHIRRNKNIIFIFILGSASLYAALRWNKRIPKSMFLTITRWINGAFHRFIRKCFLS
ncbi:MAG: glycosyltransferase family 2 protein [Sulfuricaulis sp.]